MKGPAGAAGPAGPAGPMAEANLEVSMASVGAEIAYAVVGSGFAAGENVEINLVKAGAGGADVSLGTATANDSGAFELAVDNASLSGIAAGVYTAKATGDQGALATAPLKIK